MPEPARYNLASDGLGAEEIEAAIASLRSGRHTMGAAVRAFETALAQWVGVNHAVMVNSGSSANLLVVDALLRRVEAEHAPLRVGDEVLVPALSWPTTVAPLVQLGLVPVYTDVDPRTLAISLDSAQSVLSPRTRAMFLIHPLGLACDMRPYMDFCRTHKLALIEDCCESFGATNHGRHVGAFGCAGTFSHYYSHHLTTIEGGSIITDDPALADDLRSLRAHGWIRDRSDRQSLIEEHDEFDPRFLFVIPGYNVRPMELQAAIGLVQLGKMDQQLRARERLAGQVHQWTQAAAPWLHMLGAHTLRPQAFARHDRPHSWMVMAFMLAADAPADVRQVKARLEAGGVETRPIIAGNMARHPAARRGPMRTASSLQVADQLLERGFMIGCHPDPSPQSVASLERSLKSLRQ